MKSQRHHFSRFPRVVSWQFADQAPAGPPTQHPHQRLNAAVMLECGRNTQIQSLCA